ncbi:hypothetical protein BT69DRAFT_1280128 [Atractiella rhizophila]|nr:hypothetical protein BT69DRAFT_1280128 [Atractiella rhizophila]
MSSLTSFLLPTSTTSASRPSMSLESHPLLHASQSADDKSQVDTSHGWAQVMLQKLPTFFIVQCHQR